MAIANVSTSNTYYQWMVTTNQLIVQAGQINSVVLSVYATSNNVSNTANIALVSANAATNTAIGAFTNANTFANTITASFALANSTSNNAIAAFLKANTTSNTALSAYPTANLGFGHANAAYDKANTACTSAATAQGTAVAAFNAANSSTTSLVPANNWANTLYVSALSQANGTANIANGVMLTVTAAGNNYTISVGAAANNASLARDAAGNSYALSIGAASNAWANLLSGGGGASYAYANGVANSANAYAVTVGAADNAASIIRDAASNTWANTLIISTLTSNPFSFRNKVINGRFNIWQRGTSFAAIANNAWSADRWQNTYNGTGAKTVSRQAHTPGSITGEPQYYYRVQQTTAGSGGTFNWINHKIEDVRTLAGKSATVSFYAKFASTANISTQLVQNFGSGGSAAVVTTVDASESISTSFGRISFPVSVPSITGKTVGDDSYLMLRIGLPVNATFTFDISEVQVEEGSNATLIENLPQSVELSACQRYYNRYLYTGYIPVTTMVGVIGGGGSANQMLGFINHPTTMRAYSTVTSNTSNTVTFITSFAPFGFITGIQMFGYPDRIHIYVDVTTNPVGGAASLGANNTTAFIDADSEL